MDILTLVHALFSVGSQLLAAPPNPKAELEGITERIERNISIAIHQIESLPAIIEKELKTPGSPSYIAMGNRYQYFTILELFRKELDSAIARIYKEIEDRKAHNARMDEMFEQSDNALNSLRMQVINDEEERLKKSLQKLEQQNQELYAYYNKLNKAMDDSRNALKGFQNEQREYLNKIQEIATERLEIMSQVYEVALNENIEVLGKINEHLHEQLKNLEHELQAIQVQLNRADLSAHERDIQTQHFEIVNQKIAHVHEALSSTEKYEESASRYKDRLQTINENIISRRAEIDKIENADEKRQKTQELTTDIVVLKGGLEASFKNETSGLHHNIAQALESIGSHAMADVALSALNKPISQEKLDAAFSHRADEESVLNDKVLDVRAKIIEEEKNVKSILKEHSNVEAKAKLNRSAVLSLKREFAQHQPPAQNNFPSPR